MNKNQDRKNTYQKSLSLAVVAVAAMQWMAITAVQGQETIQTTNIRITEDSDTPNALVISFQGKCEYSLDGATFSELQSKDVYTQGVLVRQTANSSETVKPRLLLTQGAVVRTGANSRVDVFFRRIGTTVRLQPDTEVRFEKMSRSTTGDVTALETLLDLRKGRIFTVVRSLVTGSTLEIRNAAGRSVVEGAPTGGMGRYIINAVTNPPRCSIETHTYP